MRITIRQFMNTPAWPPGPALRGRDLIMIGMACAGAVIVAIALVAAFDTIIKVPSSNFDLGSKPDPMAADFWPYYLAVLSSYAYFVIIVHAILIGRKHQTWRSLGFRRFEWKWLAVALVTSGLVLVVGDLISNALDVEKDAETYNRSLFLIDSATVVTISAEIAVIGPATAAIEELLFRGLLHRWIRQRLGLIAGTAASAAIFALVHFSFYNPGGALGWYWTAEIAALGAALALLFEWSGSLWPPIVLHATNNVVAVALAHMGV